MEKRCYMGIKQSLKTRGRAEGVLPRAVSEKVKTSMKNPNMKAKHEQKQTRNKKLHIPRTNHRLNTDFTRFSKDLLSSMHE